MCDESRQVWYVCFLLFSHTKKLQTIKKSFSLIYVKRLNITSIITSQNKCNTEFPAGAELDLLSFILFRMQKSVSLISSINSSAISYKDESLWFSSEWLYFISLNSFIADSGKHGSERFDSSSFIPLQT